MSKLITVIISFIAGAVLAVAIGIYTLPGLMINERQSPLGFDETLDQITANAKGMGWKVPKKWKVNFQKNLLKVTKIDIGRNTLIKMCEPKAAADILIHDELKQLSVMMPCTIAVYEKADGKTYIAMMNMSILGALFGDIVKEITTELSPQMEKMITLEK